MATPPTTIPPKPSDLPPEIAAIFSAIANRPVEDEEDDPPVWQSGYWDYDESTASEYFVNYPSRKPLSKAILDFYKMSKEELVRFQELAFQAGLYGATAERGDVPFGAKDADTFQLWQQLNKQAAGYAAAGKQNTLWDVLQDLVNNRPENLGKTKKRERAPLVTQLPDPLDIKEVVLSSAQEVLGRDVDEQFSNDFVAMYQKIVREFQQNKYSLEGTEEGGEITAPPSAEALARFRLKTERPEQAQELQSAQRQSQYLQLLKSAL